jgi:hypothetical protein
MELAETMACWNPKKIQRSATNLELRSLKHGSKSQLTEICSMLSMLEETSTILMKFTSVE